MQRVITICGICHFNQVLYNKYDKMHHLKYHVVPYVVYNMIFDVGYHTIIDDNIPFIPMI